MKHTSIILLLAVLVMSSKSYSQNEFPVLQGPYFGQKTPGLIPEIFHLALFQSREEVKSVFRFPLI